LEVPLAEAIAELLLQAEELRDPAVLKELLHVAEEELLHARAPDEELLLLLQEEELLLQDEELLAEELRAPAGLTALLEKLLVLLAAGGA